MSLRHHTFVPVFAVLTAALAIAACSKRESARDDTSTRKPDSAVVATATLPPIIAREAGVRFTPPTTWPSERFRVETVSGDRAAARQTGAAHWVALHYVPAQPGNADASLCRFIVFTREVWSRIDMEEGPPVGTTIGSIGDWVYVAQLPQSNPYDPQSIDGTQFDAMRLSIREARARFSIEGDGPETVPAADTGEL